MTNLSEEQLRVWAAKAFHWTTSSESTSRRTCLVSIIEPDLAPTLTNVSTALLGSFLGTEPKRRPAPGTSTTVRLKLFLLHLRSSSTSKVSRANIAHEHMDLSPNRNGILKGLVTESNQRYSNKNFSDQSFQEMPPSVTGTLDVS
ncbi:uncharacterized protein BT62DRAFT_1012404 [Guyanagaster necrorhizus]|uniref:Uncharacterized protein n=1 Tax=Guyanagaster necrorhizus TaxID=856835 RepID=A0A9P7VHP8_9AGAR|nr:uncharacterized protein BT62DRAFT_1012404 [Guyanagaster necrorhizus MCA 3950]KAG7440807.1 hypothetical protein BT62DRAFT_1012404 [Guyanagaster necrorhizus MCA 3950]